MSVLVETYFQKLTTLRNDWKTDLIFEMTLKWLKLFNFLQFSNFTVQRFYLLRNVSLTDIDFDVHGYPDEGKIV